MCLWHFSFYDKIILYDKRDHISLNLVIISLMKCNDCPELEFSRLQLLQNVFYCLEVK